MTEDNVSLAALEDVYRALKIFQKGAKDIPASLSYHISCLYYSCEAEIARVKQEIERLQKEKAAKEQQIESIKGKITDCEAEAKRAEAEGRPSCGCGNLYNELREAEAELKKSEETILRKEDQLGRMESAFSHVEGCFSLLNSSVNRFCSHAAENSGAQASGVASCIECLEKYRDTNL